MNTGEMMTDMPGVRIAKRLSASLVWAIPVSMAAGFVTGPLVDLDPLQVLVLPLTMLMVYPMLVNVKVRDAFSLVDSRVVGVAMAVNFLVLPVVAWVLARLFFASDAGLIAASLLAPVYLKVFAGQVVPVDLLGVLRTVVLVVAVPLIAAQLTRTVLLRRYGAERFSSRIAPLFPGMSVLGVLGIVFLAVGLKAEMIVARPELTLAIAAPLLLFYLANFVLSTILGRALFGRGDAIALVYGTVMRNLSIALGIAITTFGPEAALVLAAGYIVQVQAAAWYVRLTDRVFGPASVPAPAPHAGAKA